MVISSKLRQHSACTLSNVVLHLRTAVASRNVPVAASRRKVVGIVGGCDLDGAGAEGHINQHRIADDGDLTVLERMLQLLAVQMLRGVSPTNVERSRASLSNQTTHHPPPAANHSAGPYRVPGILRVNGDGSVTQHGLETGGGDDELFVTTHNLVSERRDDAELVRFLWIVAGDTQSSDTLQVDVVNLHE
jgi:hypothetical protein